MARQSSSLYTPQLGLPNVGIQGIEHPPLPSGALPNVAGGALPNVAGGNANAPATATRPAEPTVETDISDEAVETARKAVKPDGSIDWVMLLAPLLTAGVGGIIGGKKGAALGAAEGFAGAMKGKFVGAQARAKRAENRETFKLRAAEKARARKETTRNRFLANVGRIRTSVQNADTPEQAQAILDAQPEEVLVELGGVRNSVAQAFKDRGAAKQTEGRETRRSQVQENIKQLIELELYNEAAQMAEDAEMSPAYVAGLRAKATGAQATGAAGAGPKLSEVAKTKLAAMRSVNKGFQGLIVTLRTNPEVRAYLGPIEGRKTKIQSSTLGGVGLPEAVADFGATLYNVSDLYLRERTGAAITPVEFKRALSQILGDLDTAPEVLATRLEAAMRFNNIRMENIGTTDVTPIFAPKPDGTLKEITAEEAVPFLREALKGSEEMNRRLQLQEQLDEINKELGL